MTYGNVAVLDGSNVEGADRPRVSARARARTSVTGSDQTRPVRAKDSTAGRGSAVSRLVRVVYLDTADSWIVSESTPSIRTVWATDYAAAAPGGWLPFVVWCKVYRLPAVLLAAVLDAVKWLLIHPLRGPLSLLVAGGLLAALTA